jgi:chemotaxis protein histidine kinase CheA/ActR/RegA family two-component response regulator
VDDGEGIAPEEAAALDAGPHHPDDGEDVPVEQPGPAPELAAAGDDAHPVSELLPEPEGGFDVASFDTPDWPARTPESPAVLNEDVGEDILAGAALQDAGDAGPALGGSGSADAGLLGSALLDLAFAVELARGDSRTDAPSDITILDQHRESELALEMFETFAVECAEHLDTLNRAAMQLDREPGALEPLRRIKRALHTLKGASAAADLPILSDRCHQLEDSLAAIELSGQVPGREFAGELFSAVEEIEGLLLARGGELRGLATADVASQADAGAAEVTTLRVELTKVDGLLNTVGELVVNRAGMEQRLERLSGSLEELALTAGRLQLTSQLLEREAHGGRMFGRAPRSELRPLDAGAFAGHERIPGWDSLELDRYTEFDRLIRQLTEVGADITAAVNEMTQLRGDLETVSTRQRRLTTAMQDELMDIRMVPLASLAPRLYRVVRRVSDDRGKEVRLILEGGDTPFDKTLLDALHEPLLHLLRNAVDHGIEAPEARRRAGKPELGTIRIRAYRDGSEAVIDVIDDGIGINHEQVLARAHELGLTVETTLSRADALRLILRPGFSTRSEADEVSGRGVGLDIVESVVTRFKGRLAVDSSPGRGTIFSLRLPVMLAVTQAFMVTAGGERYAIPIANIESVADRDDQRFSRFGDAIVMELGDNAIPVIDLSARLGRPEASLLERESGWILVAQVGERRWALSVDELEGQQEIVVKPLGRFLRNTPGLLGATILGNGDVALIADVPQLLGVSRQRADLEVELLGDAGGHETAEAGRRARVAMVVDDSLSVRRVVGRTLERHGWVTVLARDGVEALELLEAGEADVIVTDIEMPRMDGFELLSSVRARPALAQTPVIVLTSRSGDKHRGRAFELGADAYLVKPFQEQELIETVQRAARATLSSAAA